MDGTDYMDGGIEFNQNKDRVLTHLQKVYPNWVPEFDIEYYIVKHHNNLTAAGRMASKILKELLGNGCIEKNEMGWYRAAFCDKKDYPDDIIR